MPRRRRKVPSVITQTEVLKQRRLPMPRPTEVQVPPKVKAKRRRVKRVDPGTPDPDHGYEYGSCVHPSQR